MREKRGRGKKGILSAGLASRPGSQLYFACAPSQLQLRTTWPPGRPRRFCSSFMQCSAKFIDAPVRRSVRHGAVGHCATQCYICVHLLIERRGGVGCISCETVEQIDELCCRALHARIISRRRGILIYWLAITSQMQRTVS
jgi:hypothetical protein